MDINLQIFCFCFSFIFGFIYYFLSTYNIKYVKNLHIILSTIITLMFIVNCVLVYLIVLYKINSGVFHVYFFFMIFLGYALGSYVYKIMS